MIRSVWAGLNLFVATLIIGGSVILAALFRVPSSNGIYDWAPRFWARWNLWASGVTVETHGLENVHFDEPQVFAANHESWYDVYALAAVIPKRYRFVAKKELERVPVFGTAWKAAGHISVDRTNRASAIDSLNRAGELIRNDNSSVVIYPEGTRSPTGELLPFKKGAFMLALHTGVEVVPVAVTGARRILPKGDWRVRGGRIIVRFGEPVQTIGYDETNRDELIREVRGSVESMLRDAGALPNPS